MILSIYLSIYTGAVPFCDNSTLPTADFKLKPLSQSQIKSCPLYNSWKYGLEQPNDYMSSVTTTRALTQFKNRLLSDQVIFLLGEADVCNDQLCNSSSTAASSSLKPLNLNDSGSHVDKPQPGCDDHSLDTDCQALWQGLCRYQRGWAYFRHLEQYYKLYDGLLRMPVTVPEVGHSACEMFSAAQTVHALFG